MIFITAKFPIKPEYADDWPSIAAEFTAATRAEDGCLWFDWSRSVDDACLLYTSPSPRDATLSRMPSSA